MSLTDKQLSDALQGIAEQFHAVDKSLAKIAVGLLALKGFVALQTNPSAPAKALEQIHAFETSLAQLDPNREGRERTEQVLDLLKMIEKHGGPKQA
jgi:hypothetical protein